MSSSQPGGNNDEVLADLGQPVPPNNTPTVTTRGIVPATQALYLPAQSFASVDTEVISLEERQAELRQAAERDSLPVPSGATGCKLQNCVFIKNLQFSTVVGLDAWGRMNKPQPVLVSVRVYREIGTAGENDEVNDTMNYSTIVKEIQEVVRGYEGSQGGFTSARDVSECIFLKSYRRWGAYATCIQIHLPKANLRAEGGFKLTSIYHERLSDRNEESEMSGFRLPCIIGVNDHERQSKQIVVVSFKIVEEKNIAGTAGSPGTINHWSDLSKQVVNITEQSTFKTVEALATKLADHIISTPFVLYVNVSVEKPNAISSVEGCGCEVNREKRVGEHHGAVNVGPRVSLLDLMLVRGGRVRPEAYAPPSLTFQ